MFPSVSPQHVLVPRLTWLADIAGLPCWCQCVGLSWSVLGRPCKVRWTGIVVCLYLPFQYVAVCHPLLLWCSCGVHIVGEDGGGWWLYDLCPGLLCDEVGHLLFGHSGVQLIEFV
jgi:hypothetical protein